jgi:hypothetical protein
MANKKFIEVTESSWNVEQFVIGILNIIIHYGYVWQEGMISISREFWVN